MAVIEKAKCTKCGATNEVKISTGHNKPENKGKKYFTCIDCDTFQWVDGGDKNQGESWAGVPSTPPSSSYSNGYPIKDPKRIERQHSQEMSLRFIEILVQTKQIKEVDSKLVKQYTDHFQKDLDQ